MSNKKANSNVKENQVKNGGEEIYEKTLSQIRDLVKEGQFVEKKNASGHSFFGPSKTRLLKLVKIKSGHKLEFNVEVPTADEMQVLTLEQAKEKHMGTCRWIYNGKDERMIEKLVKHAVKNFKPIEKVPKKNNKQQENKEEKVS